MATKYKFETIDLKEDKNVKYYTVKCSHENFEREIKVRNAVGFIKILELDKQFVGLDSLGKTLLTAQLTEYIKKHPETK